MTATATGKPLRELQDDVEGALAASGIEMSSSDEAPRAGGSTVRMSPEDAAVLKDVMNLFRDPLTGELPQVLPMKAEGLCLRQDNEWDAQVDFLEPPDEDRERGL